MDIVTASYATPCGPLLLGEYDGRIVLCDWFFARHRPTVDRRVQQALGAPYRIGYNPTLIALDGWLNAYFSGEELPPRPDILPLGTPFQCSVWRALEDVPLGQTVSYAALARAIGRPQCVRAVANAVGANQLSLLLPCHRVVASDGTLGGYAGGADAKRFLLEWEQRRAGAFQEEETQQRNQLIP